MNTEGTKCLYSQSGCFVSYHAETSEYLDDSKEKRIKRMKVNVWGEKDDLLTNGQKMGGGNRSPNEEGVAETATCKPLSFLPFFNNF